MYPLTYPDLQRLLTQSNALSDAAEAHGTLAGALCATGRYTVEDWLAEILPDGRASDANLSGLQAIFDATITALGSRQMDFEPLLPSDDSDLAERTTALGEWCHGFLYGLGSGSLPGLDAADGDVGEIVRDLTQISHVEVDPADSEESCEEAYTELVEFVRVGVQILFEQFGELRVPARPSDRSFH